MTAARRHPALVAVALAAALYLGAATVSPMAWAHVRASSDNAVRGGMAVVTFQVPNESNTGAATTALSVELPNVASARTETLPGWSVRLDRDAAAGTVRSVTWTAAPGAGIGADQFGLFRVAMQLPDTDLVSFPTTQTYADGLSVRWDQPVGPGGREPEHPAPTLTLTAGPAAPYEHHSPGIPARPDNTARWLAGSALLIAALGLSFILIRKRGPSE